MKIPVRLAMLARMMNGYLRYLAPMAATFALAACVSPRSSVVVEPAGSGRAQTVTPAARAAAPGGTYQVVKGDTLYSIAFRKGVDFRDLASWNGIAAPYTIWPGQTLKLSPGGSAASSGTRSTAAVATAPHATGTSSPAPTSTHPAVVASATPGFQAVPPTPPANAHASSAPSAPINPSAGATVATAATAPAAATSVVPVAGVPTAAHPASPATPPPAPVAAGAMRSNGGVSWRWPADGSLGKRFQSGDAIPGIEILGKTGDPVRAAADGVVVYSGNGLVGYGELVIIKHSDSFLSAYGHNSKRMVKEGQRVSAGQQIAEMGSTGSTRDELQFQIRRDGNPVDPLGYLPSR